MEKREKILVVLSIIAVLFFVVYYFTGDDKKEISAPAQEPSLTATETFVENQIKILEDIAKHRTDSQILKKAADDWTKNPFASPELIQQIEGLAEDDLSKTKRGYKKTGEIQYSGYIQIGTKFLAIINGMEYETGDTVQDTVYEIFSTSTEAVVLRSPDLAVKTIYLMDELGSLSNMRN